MNKTFKQHPKLERYYETSDGVKFFTQDNARAHARSLKDKKVNEVERGSKHEDGSPKAENAPLTPKGGVEKTPMELAKERVEAISKLETVEDIEKALEGETAKSVRKAGAERIASIQATDALNSNEENENVQTK